MTQRHQLVFVDPNATLVIESLHLDYRSLNKHLRFWFSRELPCCYARQHNTKSMIRLGLPCVVDEHKYRVAFLVRPEAIIRMQCLPTLLDMRNFFFEEYGIELPAEFSSISAASIAVYGSFLFHYLSQQSVVNVDSDLDVLVDYTGCSLHALQECVNVMTKIFRRRIDGEVRFTLLGDIALYELLNQSATELLCKRADGVKLISRVELYALYPKL